MERIDLSTNGKKIQAAYDEIRNASSSNTWVVFGYDGKSPTINVKEKGDDWDELVDEMGASKILYAYIRVLDPNTNLNKFVLVNWSGEGVPSSIKGPRAYHIPDMERLLHTRHVTINARNEDDLDEKSVKDRVAKSSGSNYSFHKEKAKKEDAVGPVGAAYKKTDAQGEITSSGRSKFWQKQDIEEKGRMQDESERLTRTRSEAERSMKERDSSESAARNQRVEQRQRTVDSQKAQEKEQWAQVEQQRKTNEQEQFERAGRELNQDREEAMHQLPSHRQEASHIRGPAQPTQYSQPESSPADPDPVRAPLRPPLPQDVESSPQRVAEPDEDLTYDTAQDIPRYKPEEPQDIYDDITEQPQGIYDDVTQTPQGIYDDVTEQPQGIYDDVTQPPQGYAYADPEPGMYDEIGDTLQKMNMQDNTPKGGVVEDIYDEIDTAAAPPAQAGFSVRAIYDYAAAEEGEISFDPGDIITDVDPIDEGWWQGTAPNGEYGLFPATYVEMV